MKAAKGDDCQLHLVFDVEVKAASFLIRHLTVEQHHDGKLRPQGAKIRLKGKWLASLGFVPGTVVEVIHSKPGEITLRLHRP